MEKHDKDKDFLIQDSTEEFETTDLDSNDEFTLEEEDFDEEPAEDIVIQPQEDKDEDEDDDDDDEEDDDEDQKSSDTEDEISMQYYMDDEPGKPEFKKSNKEDDEEDDEDDEDEYISLSHSGEEHKTPQKSSKGTKILSFEDFVDGLDED